LYYVVKMTAMSQLCLMVFITAYRDVFYDLVERVQRPTVVTQVCECLLPAPVTVLVVK